MVQALWKIGEQFGGDLAFVAAGTQDPGDRDISLRGRIGGRTHPAGNLFFDNLKGKAAVKFHA
jgi:hypothetical protein